MKNMISFDNFPKIKRIKGYDQFQRDHINSHMHQTMLRCYIEANTIYFCDALAFSNKQVIAFRKHDPLSRTNSNGQSKCTIMFHTKIGLCLSLSCASLFQQALTL